MSDPTLAQALERVAAVLRRRPDAGLHDDAPATAHWEGGTRVATRHANGHQVLTDMPAEMGGGGGQPTPGWLARAGLAACSATCVAMAAAAQGIALRRLDVRVDSRSDSRGLFGIAGDDGAPIDAGPHDLRLSVRIAAEGVPEATLRALVAQACRQSPIGRAMETALPVALAIEVEPAPAPAPH